MKCHVQFLLFSPFSALTSSKWRPLKNGNLCSSSRKAKISTTGIYGIFRGSKFEPDAEIGHKVPFCKGLAFITELLTILWKQ